MTQKIKFTIAQVKMLCRARDCENNGYPFKISSSGKEISVARRLHHAGLIKYGKNDGGLGFVVELTERGRFVADEQGWNPADNHERYHRFLFNRDSLFKLRGE